MSLDFGKKLRTIEPHFEKHGSYLKKRVYSTLKKAGQLTCTIEVNGLVIIFKCVALLVVFLLKGLFTKYVAKLAKGKSPKWYCCITAMDFEHCKIIHLFQTFFIQDTLWFKCMTDNII